MAKDTTHYTIKRAEKRLSDISTLLREDPYFIQEYMSRKRYLLQMEEERCKQVDLYLNQVLNDSWMLHYWYRWYYNIQFSEGADYLRKTLQDLMEGKLKHEALRPAQRTILEKLEAGHLLPFMGFPDACGLIVLAMQAFRETRIYSKPWYDYLEYSFTMMSSWLSWNKIESLPKIEHSEAGYKISLDGVTVSPQTVREAMSAYENTYWWQFSKKKELKDKYPFDVRKLSRAWDYHWVKDAEKRCRDVLEGKSQFGINAVKSSENLMFNQDTKDAIENPALRISNLAKDILAQTRNQINENGLAFAETKPKDKILVIDGHNHAAWGLHAGYHSRAIKLIEDLATLLIKKKGELKSKHDKYNASWDLLRGEFKRVLKIIEANPNFSSIRPYFEKLSRVCEAAWLELNTLILQKMGVPEETAIRLEGLKLQLNNCAELKATDDWFYGGDTSRYSLWQKKYSAMKNEIEDLQSLLNGHSAVDQLVVLKEMLRKTHTEIQQSCSDYFEELSKKTEIVRVGFQYTRDYWTNKDLPPEQREYSRRARAAYQTLELPIGATLEEVKTAYKKQAMIYHPDKACLTEENPVVKIRAKYQFNRVTAAYQFFCEEEGLTDYIRKGDIDLGALHRDYQCLLEETQDMRKEAEEIIPAKKAYEKKCIEELKESNRLLKEENHRLAREQANSSGRTAKSVDTMDTLLSTTESAEEVPLSRKSPLPEWSEMHQSAKDLEKTVMQFMVERGIDMNQFSIQPANNTVSTNSLVTPKYAEQPAVKFTEVPLSTGIPSEDILSMHKHEAISPNM